MGMFLLKFQGHLGFVYLPTDLRPRATNKSVPDWNQWDAALPRHFFNMSKMFLSDDGFLAILHSGQFSHASTIYKAAEAKGLFKHIQSYTVLLPTPMWKPRSNFQVEI